MIVVIIWVYRPDLINLRSDSLMKDEEVDEIREVSRDVMCWLCDVPMLKASNCFSEDSQYKC